MKHTSKIAIIGGTGKSGKYLVRELKRQGINFKILVRNPQKIEIAGPLVEVVKGDIADYDCVSYLIKDCNAIISTLGMGIPKSPPTIFSTAGENILNAMNTHGVKRYITTAGLNVDTPFDIKGTRTKLATDWMYTNYPVSTADRQNEYRLLSNCGLDWTIVRLPLIQLTDERTGIKESLVDCPGDKISATDLASFLIRQLNDTTYYGQAPFIANSE